MASTLGRARGWLIVAAKQRAKFAVVVFFVFNDVVEDGDGAFVAEVFELLAIVGDVAALFDLETAQGHADAAGAVGERIGFAAGIAFIDGFGRPVRRCGRATARRAPTRRRPGGAGPARAPGSVSRSASAR